MGGRFISRDPLRFDGGDINLYRFAHNDGGFNKVDPFGLASVSELRKQRNQDLNGDNSWIVLYKNLGFSRGRTTTTKHTDFDCEKDGCQWKLSGYFRVTYRYYIPKIYTATSSNHNKSYVCRRTEERYNATFDHEQDHAQNNMDEAERINRDFFGSPEYHGNKMDCYRAGIRKITEAELEYDTYSDLEGAHMNGLSPTPTAKLFNTSELQASFDAGLCREN